MPHEEMIRLYVNRNVIPDWTRRNMENVVPEFKNIDPEHPAIWVTREVCEKIAEDCVQQFHAQNGMTLRTKIGYSNLHSFCKEAMVLFDNRDKLVPLWDKKTPDAVAIA